MFNTQIFNKMKFNSVSGTIVKSHSDSVMVNCHKKSRLADQLFDRNDPHVMISNYKKNIHVLQVMLCSDDWYLVEYVVLEED